MLRSKLELLSEKCKSVNLETQKSEWVLKINHEKFGEIEFKGDIQDIINQAANPIIDDLNPLIDFDLLNNSDVPFKQNLIDAIADHQGWFDALANICQSFMPTDKEWLIFCDWSERANSELAVAYKKSDLHGKHTEMWSKRLAEIINTTNPGKNISPEEVKRDWIDYFNHGYSPEYSYNCEATHQDNDYKYYEQ